VSLEEEFRVVWRQRLWLLGLSLLAAILVFVVASLGTTTYSTSAVIGTTPGPAIAGNAVANDSVAFTATRYDRLIGSDAVLTSGAQVASKGTTLQDMRDRVSSSIAPRSGTITVTVKGTDADETARVAAAVANATISQGQADQQAQRTASLNQLQANRDQLKAQLDQLAADAPDRPQVESQFESVAAQLAAQQAAPLDVAQLLQTPAVPKSTSRDPKSLAVFAFLLALVLGAAGVIIWTRYRRRAAGAGAKSIVGDEGRALEPAVARAALDEPIETDVPVLAISGQVPNALRVSMEEGHRVIGVVGYVPATNDVSLALAKEMAADGFSVLVVEGDMSHPTLASRLSIRSQSGLTDVLSGGASVERTLRQTSIAGLQILPAGRPVERPDVLIGLDNVQRVLSMTAHDIVIVSMPPSMAAADRDAMASQLHGIVLVVRDGRMRSRQVNAALADVVDLHNILVAIGLVTIVPSTDLEIVGRKPDRAMRRADVTEQLPSRPTQAALGRGSEVEAEAKAEMAPPEQGESLRGEESPVDETPGDDQDATVPDGSTSGAAAPLWPPREANGHRDWVEDMPAGDSPL
jgi:Mrp family chromosome partitioning ATPase/capsular polysaccharide biosynthesis protein